MFPFGKIQCLLEVTELADKNRKPSTIFRERFHPMEYYSDHEFWIRYRFMKTSVSYINCLIKEDFEETRGDPLSSMDKLLITLRFYATGSFQRVLGDLVNIDQSTVCRSINETSLKIANLFHRFVRLPTPEQQQQYAESFYEEFGFPRVVGLIDGTHVPCKSPGGPDAELFRCRKGYFSINCQVTCNADMRIMDFVARWHGSAHDQTIFNFSTLKMKCEENYFGRYFLLGDNGYANKSYLLTPLSNPITEQERKYNRMHKTTRNLAERCIGVWKMRFPVLQTKSRQKVKNTLKVITATAILHNIARDLNEPPPPPPEIPLPALYQMIHPVVRNVREALPDNSTRNLMINIL